MNALTSLLYISHSRIDPADATAEVARIVKASVIANLRHGLTGALMFTGVHFAQIVEGRDDDIEVLVARLDRDPRHDNLIVVDRSPLVRRRFADWSMAYHGPSQFVARHVTRLLNDPAPAEKLRATECLSELMCEFVRP